MSVALAGLHITLVSVAGRHHRLRLTKQGSRYYRGRMSLLSWRDVAVIVAASISQAVAAVRSEDPARHLNMLTKHTGARGPLVAPRAPYNERKPHTREEEKGMRRYNLQSDFIDPPAEQALIAAVAARPEVYWEVLDLLPAGCFAVHGSTWEQVAAAIEAEQAPQAPPDWTPAEDPVATARRLADLHQCRMLAGVLERLARGLHSDLAATDLLTSLEEEAARIQAAARELAGGRLLWADSLLGTVIEEAREKHKQRLETGTAALGITTGIPKLDELLGGLRDEALYILAGPPGSGKTSFALQLACFVARQAPVVYVTFENSPCNLVLKAVCRIAGISPANVERGLTDPAKLLPAVEEFRPPACRIAFLEGTTKTTTPQIRARALQAMNKCKVQRCLVAIDYVQRMAHNRGYTDLRSNVSALVGELVDLARRLESPVLALSSLSRGGYKGGEGRADISTLKESGDLEYGADVVMFLAAPEERQAVPPARAVDLVIAKNRGGPVGSVPLVFRADIGSFGEEARW